MEELKVCKKCGVQKPLSAYWKTKIGNPFGACKECWKERHKTYKQTFNRKPRKTIPCLDCGAPIRDRKDRPSTRCRKCNLERNKCLLCGRILPKEGMSAHTCIKPKPWVCRVCACDLTGGEKERLCKSCTCKASKAAKEKARARRHRLIETFGGACSSCGYSRYYGALEFHHINPEDKKKTMDRAGRVSLTEVRNHPERFKLLCANCHAEEHDNMRNGGLAQSPHTD